ncbi:hypothetical protein BC629DRAFT_918895 [Irpex lacteus]|nr:hypothetical protein BC629DRAFT_918895 [Irpex lacteus]
MIDCHDRRLNHYPRGSIALTFNVAPNSIQQLTFGTCRVFFGTSAPHKPERSAGALSPIRPLLSTLYVSRLLSQSSRLGCVLRKVVSGLTHLPLGRSHSDILEGHHWLDPTTCWNLSQRGHPSQANREQSS